MPSTNTVKAPTTWWSWLEASITQTSLAAYIDPFMHWLLPGWHSNAYRTQVLAVRQETEDVYSLILRPAKRWRGFQAGQYVQLTLEQNGVMLHRFFSISSSPSEYQRTGLIELSIRKQVSGRVTPWLPEQFASGGIVSISPARGEFLLPAEGPVLLIGGGSGITPFRSMLNELAEQYSDRSVHLLYFARTAHHALFQTELERIQQRFPNLAVTYLNDEQHGLISAEHVQQYCPDVHARQVLICGPAPMIARTRTLLAELGLKPEQIGFEYFGAAPLELAESVDRDAVRRVAFERSAQHIDTTLEQPKSLLALAEDAGLKPVSGCRVGVCHQCVCRKKSGVVINTLTGQRSDTGEADIQLCVSVAQTDVVLDI